MEEGIHGDCNDSSSSSIVCPPRILPLPFVKPPLPPPIPAPIPSPLSSAEEDNSSSSLERRASPIPPLPAPLPPSPRGPLSPSPRGPPSPSPRGPPSPSPRGPITPSPSPRGPTTPSPSPPPRSPTPSSPRPSPPSPSSVPLSRPPKITPLSFPLSSSSPSSSVPPPPSPKALKFNDAEQFNALPVLAPYNPPTSDSGGGAGAGGNKKSPKKLSKRTSLSGKQIFTRRKSAQSSSTQPPQDGFSGGNFPAAKTERSRERERDLHQDELDLDSPQPLDRTTLLHKSASYSLVQVNSQVEMTSPLVDRRSLAKIKRCKSPKGTRGTPRAAAGAGAGAGGASSQQTPRRKVNRVTAKFEIDQASFEKMEPKARNRLQVIREIFQTEQEYATDLEIIVETFLCVLKDEEILSACDLDTIFSCVHVIKGLSFEMLDKLTALLSQDDGERKIGEFFLSIADMIKIYGSYVGNQDKALATLEKCRKKSKPFEIFLSNMMENPICRGLPLTAFLIKPTQRVCKYPLLLRELLKSTDEQSEEFETLKSALQVMEKTTSYVNERKREIENHSKIIEVAQCLQGISSTKLVERGRVLIKEGLCEKVNVHGKAQTRKFWLFNDLIVYAAPSPVSNFSFIFKDMIPINVCIASPIADQKGTLQLTRLDKKKKYLITASSEEEMMKWVDAIMEQSALANKTS